MEIPETEEEMFDTCHGVTRAYYFAGDRHLEIHRVDRVTVDKDGTHRI